MQCFGANKLSLGFEVSAAVDMLKTERRVTLAGAFAFGYIGGSGCFRHSFNKKITARFEDYYRQH